MAEIKSLNGYAFSDTKAREDIGRLSEDIDALKFDASAWGLPTLHLTGDTSGMSKDVKKTLTYSCKDAAGNDRTGTCTVKWQGNTSVNYEKKNYTIVFDQAFEAVAGWGTQTKYCMKANFVDCTHTRNIVSAKLWGKIIKSRSGAPSALTSLPNAGAIDGFPIVIVLNDKFHGLYTWNIPKEGWMFGMGSGTQEAFISADNPADDTAFRGETLLDGDGMELEYVTDESNSDWVKTSLNRLINACVNSWGGDLDTTVAQYLDWGNAIDYYIHNIIIDGTDNVAKNYLFATFDGTKWYFTPYDMDATYGNKWNGKYMNRPNTGVTFNSMATESRIFELIKRFKTNELKARYAALRADKLSEYKIAEEFENFVLQIPAPVYQEDVKVWPTIPGSAVKNVDQILRWVKHRLAEADKWINALPAQETPVEPEQPEVIENYIPVSTDASGAVYNGTGYKDNVRISTSDYVSESTQSGQFITGFIPVKKTDVIRVSSNTWGDSPKNAKIVFYNANHEYMAGYTSNGYVVTNEAGGYSEGTASTSNALQSKSEQSVTVGSDGMTTLNIKYSPNCTDLAYMRYDGNGSGANAVVMLN